MIWPHAALAAALLVLQILDVHSTNLALRRPDVVEVGDTAIGMGNAVGWAMKRWGRLWWLVKLPFLVALPLVWTAVPLAAEPALSAMLSVADAYFFKLVRQNYVNAKPRERETPTCRPMS